ncbi:MAG: hypothetical protein QOI13_730 [Paraburkholderia sp.]|nr:hypothetical protein [Paraburkholderia sp.]
MSSFNTAGSRVGQLFAKPTTTLSICVFAASATFFGHASAASFKCTNHSSASEKIVCSDPQLSTLDDRLAAAYQRAKAASPDTKSIEAVRTEQWLWRQHNCTDKACVLNWYERRIAELNADYEQTQPAQRAALEASLIDRNVEPSAAAAIRQLKLSSRMAAVSIATQTSK